MGNAIPEREYYEARVRDIGSWVHEAARQLAGQELRIEVGRDPQALTRTSSTVRIATRHGREVLVCLSKEEFLDEYGMFERNAAPRLRDALCRMRAPAALRARA